MDESIDLLDLIVPILIPLFIQILLMLFGLTTSLIIRASRIIHNCTIFRSSIMNNLDCLKRITKFLLFSTSIFNTIGTLTICWLESSHKGFQYILVFVIISIVLSFVGYVTKYEKGGLGAHFRKRGHETLSNNLYIIGAIILMSLGLIASIETKFLV